MAKKLKNIASTQQYMPILDVRDDIIITKDERYIKLMEFSPINFLFLNQSIIFINPKKYLALIIKQKFNSISFIIFPSSYSLIPIRIQQNSLSTKHIRLKFSHI